MMLRAAALRGEGQDGIGSAWGVPPPRGQPSRDGSLQPRRAARVDRVSA